MGGGGAGAGTGSTGIIIGGKAAIVVFGGMMCVSATDPGCTVTVGIDDGTSIRT